MRKTEKKCIAVIDDEVQMLKVIGRYVTETLKQKNMIDKINVRLFCMAEEFLESVKKDEKYLAVFSDIEMDTMNGIELGKWLNKKRAQEKGEAIPLIFITSHEEFAIESYRLDAYQYILKTPAETETGGADTRSFKKYIAAAERGRRLIPRA